ncbi:MAG TPA: DUF3597 domain-containing protein [Stellaceae bacterium]|jgi:hypothetical protein
MSIFGTIMDKIFHHGAAAASSTVEPSRDDAAGGSTQPAARSGATSAAAAPGEAVDVEAVLNHMASQKGGGGNWQTSIVDLLKLLDLDSSLEARRQLADELNVHAGAAGSAEENIALHKAVMRQLAENGGKVPESLKS